MHYSSTRLLRGPDRSACQRFCEYKPWTNIIYLYPIGLVTKEKRLGYFSKVARLNEGGFMEGIKVAKEKEVKNNK